MRSLTVSKLLEEFSKRDINISIPDIPNSSVSFIQRIYDICNYHQYDAIVNRIGEIPSPNGLPPKKMAKVLNKYQSQFDQELKFGIGRLPLINRIPEYNNPEQIPDIVIETYNKNPIEGGNVAQRLLAYNPDISVPLNWFFPVEEKTRSIKIPGTDILINYRLDLEDFVGGLYEFKLTTRKNLKGKLSEAILQLYVYDFVQRLRFNIQCWQGMIIDIALVDEKKIVSYSLFSKPIKIPGLPGETVKYLFKDKNLNECKNYYQKNVKEILLKIFSEVCSNQILAIKEALDNTYKIILPKMYEDEAKSILRHKEDG